MSEHAAPKGRESQTEQSNFRFFGRIDGPAPDPATWACKIGECDRSKLPPGSDAPMREAVERAYYGLTGEWPSFIFSGWGAELDEPERAVVEDRLPESCS